VERKEWFSAALRIQKAISAAYASKEVAEKKLTSLSLPTAISWLSSVGDEVFCCETIFLRMLEQCSVDPSIERLF
jgi:hypothetical protein